MPAQGQFNLDNAELEPGEPLRLALLVQNLGTGTESYALTPTGMAAAWTTIRPAYITLFGGSNESVDIDVRAPRLATTTAGPLTLGVRIVPQGTPDEVVEAETTVHVAEIGDRRLTVLQPAIRARRRARFEVMIENLGNTQASCRMNLIEPTGRLTGRFDPPSVGVPSGGSTLTRLTVTTRRMHWDRQSHSIPFIAEAEQSSGGNAVSGSAVSGGATLVQASMVPDRLGARLIGAAVGVAALTAAWFGVVRPEIRRSAERAVNALPPVTAPVGPIGTGSTVPTGSAPVVDPSLVGEPFSSSLPSGAAATQVSKQSYTVPSGKHLSVKQFVIQNPAGDQGTASLAIGTNPFEYNLAALDGIDANQGFLDPLVLKAGDTITFSVTCAAVGRAGADTCSASATIIGRLVDN